MNKPDAGVSLLSAERHPGPFSGPDAEFARACAMAVIPWYSNDDGMTHQRIMKDGIWNDHIAVQAALAAIHSIRRAGLLGDAPARCDTGSREVVIEECAQVAENMRGRIRGPITTEVAQAIRALSGTLPATGGGTVDLTNHHNALKCPYCNPEGLTFATPSQGGEPVAYRYRHKRNVIWTLFPELPAWVSENPEYEHQPLYASPSVMEMRESQDPANVWDDYCAEVPAECRSPQGALAFGFAAALNPSSVSAADRGTP